MDKIAVIGSCNTDFVVNTEKIPEGGETVIGKDFTINYGGKGANQAVAVLRIGGEVSFISKLGNDNLGKQMLLHFQKENMDISNIYTCNNLSSGVAFIMVDDRAENRIVVIPGANENLLPDDILKASATIESCEFLLLQLEIPISTVEYIVNKYSAQGKKIILNPAPARCMLSDGLFSKLYLITPNETEAEILTGIVVSDEDSAKKAAECLLQKGVQNVVITLGSKGAMISNSDGNIFVPAYKVNAVDTTAAGDVFNGALTVALSEGRTLTDAARFACAASAISVTRYGAQDSVPYRDELNEFINLKK